MTDSGWICKNLISIFIELSMHESDVMRIFKKMTFVTRRISNKKSNIFILGIVDIFLKKKKYSVTNGSSKNALSRMNHLYIPLRFMKKKERKTTKKEPLLNANRTNTHNITLTTHQKITCRIEKVLQSRQCEKCNKKKIKKARNV